MQKNLGYTGREGIHFFSAVGPGKNYLSGRSHFHERLPDAGDKIQPGTGSGGLQPPYQRI